MQPVMYHTVRSSVRVVLTIVYDYEHTCAKTLSASDAATYQGGVREAILPEVQRGEVRQEWQRFRQS